MVHGPEFKLEAFLVREVEKRRGFCVKLGPAVRAGLPDRMVLLRGTVYFVEMKAPKGKLRKIQSVFRERLATIGFDVFVLDSETKVREFLRELDRRT